MNSNLLNFKENLKILKIHYIWEINENDFEVRVKILKTNTEDFKIPILQTIYNEKDIYLAPRYITINGFYNQNDLFTLCDVYDLNENNISFNKNHLIKEEIKKKKITLNISIIIYIKLDEFNSKLKKLEFIDIFINLLIKSKINISQYYTKSEYLILESDFLDINIIIEEYIVIKYILNYISKNNNLKNEILPNTELKFYDNHIINDSSKIKTYFDKLNKLNTIIPENLENLKIKYLIYRSNEKLLKCLNDIVNVIL
jgi:hypothetical protein